MNKATPSQKIEALKDPVVKQVVFDALHRRRIKYSAADNSGQHSDYVEIVDDMKKDYEAQKSVDEYREKKLMEDFRDQDRS